MSQSYGPGPDRADNIALLRAAVERGVTFFDTAEVYGPFVNEELVGEALEPFRGRSSSPPSSGSPSTPTAPRPACPADPNTSSRSPTPPCGGCVDAIDLFYQHRVNPDVPIEDVAGAVKDLIEAGKVNTSASSTKVDRRSWEICPAVAAQRRGSSRRLRDEADHLLRHPQRAGTLAVGGDRPQADESGPPPHTPVGVHIAVTLPLPASARNCTAGRSRIPPW